jgi:bifunctional non-homologous end joining protein LigD
VEGTDLRTKPIEERRQLLAGIVGTHEPPLVVSTALTGKVDQLLVAACKAGFEGLVGKRAGSPYRPGRGLDWIKLKCQRRQEFAVVGYLPFTGSQRGIVGSLILALHHEGQFVFAGKVGTGFDQRTRAELGKLLEERHADRPTAIDVPRSAGAGLVRWATPGLVAEIRFSEWTEGHHARHPSYLGLRPDKLPEDCVLEGPPTQKPARGKVVRKQ